MNTTSSGDTENPAVAFVQSEMFARTFRDGMAMVEEAASYLDGEGRSASKQLSREPALSYAGASMRLTTQLMQIASWLLVLRALREGEINVAEASDEKYRIKAQKDDDDGVSLDGLPVALTAIIDAANQLHDRIARLDQEIFKGDISDRVGDAAGQQQALMRAFGQSGGD